MSDPQPTDRVPLERLEAMERQLFPKLPNNQVGHDIRAVVLEVMMARKAEALKDV